MERASICTICGKVAKPAYSCRLCGAVCCHLCFNLQNDICKRCAGGRMYSDGK